MTDSPAAQANGRPAGTPATGAGRTSDAERIQADIEATRAQLARTVDEISARLDVRAHAAERAYRARDTVVETYRESPPAVLGALAVVGLIVTMLVRRRGRKR